MITQNLQKNLNRLAVLDVLLKLKINVTHLIQFFTSLPNKILKRISVRTHLQIEHNFAHRHPKEPGAGYIPHHTGRQTKEDD